MGACIPFGERTPKCRLVIMEKGGEVKRGGGRGGTEGGRRGGGGGSGVGEGGGGGYDNIALGCKKSVLAVEGFAFVVHIRIIIELLLI